MTLMVVPTCRAAAEQLAEHLQAVYLRDKKASETVRAAVLEALGLLVEAAPLVSLQQTLPTFRLGMCLAHISLPIITHILLCGLLSIDSPLHKATVSASG